MSTPKSSDMRDDLPTRWIVQIRSDGIELELSLVNICDLVWNRHPCLYGKMIQHDPKSIRYSRCRCLIFDLEFKIDPGPGGLPSFQFVLFVGRRQAPDIDRSPVMSLKRVGMPRPGDF